MLALVSKAQRWFENACLGAGYTLDLFVRAMGQVAQIGRKRRETIQQLNLCTFGSMPVVFSVLAEAVLLSTLGGLFGGLVAWAAFDGYQTSTMNFQSFSQVAFAFAVTPKLLGTAIVYAIFMGLAGGMLPAIRAARLPVVTALREL